MNSVCMIGYEGPICQTCTKLNGVTYSKRGEISCKECYTMNEEIGLFVMMIIFFIIFYGVLVK